MPPSVPLSVGAFVWVPNSGYAPGAHATVECPEAWVGRVVEIGPMVRCEWMQPAAPGSPMCYPSGHLFSEAARALRPVRSAMFDGDLRLWRVTLDPRAGTFPSPAAPAAAAAATAAGGGGTGAAAPTADVAVATAHGPPPLLCAAGLPLCVGTFVILRNPKFTSRRPEGGENARYWLARVSAQFVVPPQRSRPQSRGGAAAARGGRGGGAPAREPLLVPSIPLSVAADPSGVLDDAGRLRLQWLMEVGGSGAGTYRATARFAAAVPGDVAGLPEGLELSADGGWTRRSAAPLVFPGDEAAVEAALAAEWQADAASARLARVDRAEDEVAAARAAAASAAEADAAARAVKDEILASVGRLPPRAGGFAFFRNPRYVPSEDGAPENPAAPRYWVVRLVAQLSPDAAAAAVAVAAAALPRPQRPRRRRRAPRRAA